MPPPQSRIRALPSDVIAKIKSSTSIVHLTGVILELVKNSLDANAHTVFVTVDFKRGGCIVEDDGDGIPPVEFEAAGGLGKPHRMSPNLLIGMFRVKSRALTLQRPDELEREWDYLRNSLVSLLLANPQFSKLVFLDVERNKRMSIRLGTASIPESCIAHVQREFDLKRIGSILTQSGLITPQDLDNWHEISASVSGLIIQGAISLQPSPTRKIQFISLGKVPVLSHNSSNVLYNEVNRLFASSDFSNAGAMSGRSSVTHPASLVNQIDAPSNASTRSWAKPVNKWPMFYIRIDTNAIIQLDDDGSEHLPESAKSVQRIVDVLGAMVYEFLRQHNLRPRNGKQQTSSSDQTQIIRSKVSKAAGSSRGPLKQGRPVSSTEEAFSGHLKIPSFPRTQSVNSSQSFANWSRVKTAKDIKGHSPTHRPPRRSHAAPDIMQGESSLPILPKNRPTRRDDGTTLPNSPNQSVSDGDRNRTEDLPGDSPSDKMINWIDPHTKLAYMINPRTGQTMNSRKSLATQRSPTECVDTSSKHPTQTFWMENLLGAWDNPSFSRTETPIPNLGAESAGQQNTTTSSHDCFKGIGSLDTAQVAKYRGKLRRRVLETAEVIAQVDKKFILAKVHTAPVILNCVGPSNDVLLLIDQHAADERCRIELLFREMFLSAGQGENLESGHRVRTVQVGSLAFEVSSTEGDLFQKYTGLFSDWGIEYVTQGQTKSTVLITVHTLPILIAERCRLEPHVLTDLMRREIWSSEEDGRKPFQLKKTFETQDADQDLDLSDNDNVAHKETSTSYASRSWVQKMNGCPQGIVDLLNSRACRTSIMFNDPLNIEECQALVSRLARCAFPFQCAHGRPSMIPILDLRYLSETAVSLPLDLDTRASTYDYYDGMSLDFVEAFKTRYVT
ncbi:DNA mismatch repair protein [Penicillium expansum]|uniref:DNA mismatch repair protein n=1 Tax=Penicillium expansum TaxID=27334 RepID=A0A0A2JEM3_PENEN|nr:DNA mismatch repair protein [Penicillium expansum]KGO53201.1 DNA mismatch repair protein [Penicillium expansum]KGO66528.1 DNA mismatch repair protein [Penicillium expansum]